MGDDKYDYAKERIICRYIAYKFGDCVEWDFRTYEETNHMIDRLKRLSTLDIVSEQKDFLDGRHKSILEMSKIVNPK